MPRPSGAGEGRFPVIGAGPYPPLRGSFRDRGVASGTTESAATIAMAATPVVRAAGPRRSVPGRGRRPARAERP